MKKLNLITFDTLEEAQAANEKALAALKAKDPTVHGSQWSEIYSDGVQFGIHHNHAVAEILDAETVKETPLVNEDLKAVAVLEDGKVARNLVAASLATIDEKGDITPGWLQLVRESTNETKLN